MTEDLQRTVIEGGEVQSLSVTSISKFDPTQKGGCNRKFYYRYVMGLEEPQSKRAALGTEVHEEIKQYLQEGKLPTSKIAKAAVPYCDELSRPLVIEEDLSGLVAAGVPIIGRPDVLDATGVVDWKTTGRKFDALPEGVSLIHTVQMPGYAWAHLQSHQDMHEVRLTHVYLSTLHPGRHTKRTAVFDREVVEERFREIEQVVDDIKRVVRLNLIDVQPNTNACDDFGGCFFKTICPYGKGMTMAGMMEQLKLRKMKAEEEVKPGPTELALDMLTRAMTVEEANILPPDAPEPTLKKRGRPKKVVEEVIEQAVEGPTYFKGKMTKVSLGRTLNLGQFEGVRIDLEYQVEEGDHRAAFDYLRHEMRELEKYFKESE